MTAHQNTLNTAETKHIGIDVSKMYLDISPFDKKATRILNTRVGINALVKRIKALDTKVLLCCEATGGYEKLLLNTVCEAEIPIACVNPKRVRSFAQAGGINAKTDKLDALALANFARVHNPNTYKAPTPAEAHLHSLVDRRAQLVAMRTQEENRLKLTTDSFVKSCIESSIRAYDCKIEKIEKALGELRKTDSDLNDRCKRLEAIKGVGEITAITLLALMPELTFVGKKAACALAGLAPWASESGARFGARSCRGGRGDVRGVLYMAALSASRHNHVLRDYYRGLTARGKHSKTALTAVMRKLLCLVRHLLRNPGFKLQTA
jgi:transposase